ncbi:unnamed protein product [Kluyveromyces dobzhanskii CBS 2104]|uniref:WGS project CCBQ000000000 data, contig 00223 n=1 Tax=Kluyveromyces dobzhanskii CBS 2104 TaxID=1427455 RepID=A0A0A8L5H8_9SACH|nr:unnamed protein product [Kluyveromyces dobzhanskii CBS 2104]
MKGLRWSTRNKKSEEKPKGSGNSTGSSSSLATHRGSAAHTHSGLSITRPGSLPKSTSNFYLSDSQSRSQRSLSSSSSRHDLKTVTDEESIESISGHSGTLTPVISSSKDSVTNGSSIGSAHLNGDTSDHNKSNTPGNRGEHSTSKVQSDASTNSHLPTLQLNTDNFDSMVFKTGWMNKSHGTVHSSSTPSSASSITSSRNHRESRIYNAELSSASSSRNSSSYTQEYRLYKAQLRGCVLNLYKSGINNAKFFDPTLDPPDAKHDHDDDHLLPSTPIMADIPAVISKDHIRSSRATSSNSGSGFKPASAPTSTGNERSVMKSITEIKYLSELYPHPELKFDKHDQIVYGTVESICHALLFSLTLETKKILDLILMLPLIEDFSLFFQCFCLYGMNFSKNSEKLTNDSKQFHKISPATDELMTQRLALVVKTVLDVFPGFLLDDITFNLIIQLLDIISLHDDEISNTLKLTIAESHNKLNELVSFSKNPIDQKAISRFVDVKQFLKLDNTYLADQIHAINLKYNRVWSPQTDYSLLYDSVFNKKFMDLNPLVFNNKSNVHYVSRLLVEHLFKKIDGNFLHPKERALVLTKWVQLGCTFEKFGDMVSWLAIATIICSQPILRLSVTWQYISDQTLKIIFKDWVPTIVQLDRRQLSFRTTNSVFILAPPNLNEKSIRENVIPYFGDLTIHTNDLTDDTMFRYLEKKIYRTKNAFQKWQQRLPPVQTHSSSSNSPQNLDIPFYHYLNYHVSQPRLNIESLMKMSVKLEPPNLDNLDASTNLSKRSSLLSGSYLPILFNQLFPAYSLFSQSALLGAAGAQHNKHSVSETKTMTRSGKALSVSGPLGIKSDDKSFITGVDRIDEPVVRELSTKQSNKQMLLKSIRDVFSINVDLFHVLDDLTFKSVDDWDRKSRPTSVVIETPKRFSVQSSRDSQDIMNRLSDGVENMDFFKNISKTTDNWDESVINVVLKSASQEKLFDVLVLTSSVFSKLVSINDISPFFKNHQDKFNRGSGAGLLDYAVVKLCMDNDLYTRTFFSTYKSFTTTASLLENLAKRFIGAKSCAVSIERLVKQGDSRKKASSSLGVSNNKFPCWDSLASEFDQMHYVHTAKIQIGTAEALFYLTNEHYADFNDDLHNNKLLLDIIKIMDQEIIEEWEIRIRTLAEMEKSLSTDLKSYHEKLKEILQKVKSSYQRQLYRPVGVSRHNRNTMKILNSFSIITMEHFSKLMLENSTDDPMISSFHRLKPDSYSDVLSWMYQLDNLVFAHLKLATVKEWMVVSQLLEGFSYESLSSLFRYPQLDHSYSQIASGNAQTDDLEIMDVFKWLVSLVNANEELLFKKLPYSVQLIVNLHISLTNFFIVQIAQPEKSYDSRLETCSVLLQMLGFSRYKNSSIDLFQGNVDLDSTISPHLPSFIESALVNAILSPESRKFELSWKMASERLDDRTNLKNISNVLDCVDVSIKKFIEYDGISSQRKNFCPCPGWFVGRLLEISQLVPNMSIENSKLINFDKRRFAFNLVLNYQQILQANDANSTVESPIFGSILNHCEIDPDLSFRVRAKGVATNESKNMKYQVRGIFNEVLIAEMYKIKRENKKREHLLSQEKEQIRSQYLQQDLKQKSIDMQNSVLAQVQQQSLNLSSNSRTKRSSIVNNARSSVIYPATNGGHVGRKIGGFFKRPFSISGFTSSASSNGINSMLVNSIQQNGSVAPIDLPKIVDEELQDQKPVISIKTFDIKKCINVNNFSNDPSMMFCFKILMENGQEHLVQTIDSHDLDKWLKNLSLSKRYSFHSRKYRGKTSNKVFGVPIEDICEREGTLTPTIVHKLLEEIELRGLDEVGLYRVPGSVGSINLLKNAFDDEGAVNNVFTLEDDRWFEINTIAGCFKLYLRELPESLFTNEKLPEFIKLVELHQTEQLMEEDFEDLMRQKLRTLPIYNYHMIKRIFQHLHKVHNHMDTNRMDANNLAIVFSMSFINQDDLANSMGPSLGLLQSLLQKFIKFPETYFVYE